MCAAINNIFKTGSGTGHVSLEKTFFKKRKSKKKKKDKEKENVLVYKIARNYEAVGYEWDTCLLWVEVYPVSGQPVQCCDFFFI